MASNKKQNKELEVLLRRQQLLRSKLNEMTETQLLELGTVIYIYQYIHRPFMSEEQFQAFMRGFEIDHDMVWDFGIRNLLKGVSKEKFIKIYLETTNGHTLVNFWAEMILSGLTGRDLLDALWE